jgi:hypothetical protein
VLNVNYKNEEDEGNINGIVHQSPHTITHSIYSHLSVQFKRVWNMFHTERLYPYQIQCIHPLEFRAWVAEWSAATGLMLTIKPFVTFCSLMWSILPMMKSTVPETMIYGIMIHMNSKVTLNISFLSTCSITGDYITVHHIFPEHLAGDIHDIF